MRGWIAGLVVSAALATAAGCGGSGSGRSIFGCDQGGVRCVSGCANLATDAQNCGACGRLCNFGQACVQGICVGGGIDGGSNSNLDGGSAPGGCASPLITCGSRCVDTLSDNANCGGCNRACPMGKVCAAGFCSGVSGCTAPLVPCGAACLNVDHDNSNCGACAHACPSNQTCVAGACTCSGGRAACGSSCVDALTDPSNCGACGAVCTAAETCTAGLCKGNVNSWPMLGGDPLHSGFNARETGSPPLTMAWRRNLTSATLWPAVTDGTAVYVTELTYFGASTTLWALSPADGHTLWSHDFGGNIFGIGQAAVDGGHVYVAQCDNDGDTFMFSLNAANGSLGWSQPFDAQWEHYWAPLVLRSQIYFDGGYGGGLYGLGTANGAQLFFNEEPAGYDEWSPMYLRGSVYTFIAGVLRAHDPQSGNARTLVNLSWDWQGWSMKTSPVSDGTRIFVIAPPTLYAVAPDAMMPTWSADAQFAGMPAVANGTVYALAGGGLRALDAATGAVLWNFAGDTTLAYPPVVAGHTVYVASVGSVYAVDTVTHQTAWTGSPGGWLSVAGGALYVAQSDGTLSAYSLSR